MRRTLLGAAVAACAMLAVVAVSSALARSKHHGHGGITIHVVERATSDTPVDNAPARDSVGDTLAFGNAVYDATNTTQIGTDGGQCVRTVPGVSFECAWTTMLKDGQITVEGPFLDAGDSTLAITGGTGAYRTARGTMDLHARNAQGSEFDFTFHVIDAGR
ncbi:MAG TPA: allene oxide cyclase family protein [Gaiellales bacterium]|nr:allene oxide cyclase family protein [Gaiellales bacterium]